MSDHRPTLKNWSWDGVGLRGEVYGYPGKPEGRMIATSNLDNIYRDDDGVLLGQCRSRTYILEGIDPGFEESFPGAEERLIQSFKERQN